MHICLDLEGKLDDAENQMLSAALSDELGALTRERDPDEDAERRLVGSLADIARAWTMATPVERNKLARHLAPEADIQNRTAVEVTPRPDLLPFVRR